MAKNYLKTVFYGIGFEVGVKEAVYKATEGVNSELFVKIGSFLIAIPEKKLKFKIKKTSSEGSSPKQGIKKNREDLSEDHRTKVKECKEFTKRISGEKKERQRKIQEREAEFRIGLLKDLEEQKKYQEQIFQKLESEKKARLINSLQKTETRTKTLETKKENIKKLTPSPKPLFKQMEEAYKHQILIPRLEQHKAELARKRLIFRPLDPEELQEHSKNHEELKKLSEYRRRKEKEQKILESQINYSTKTFQSKFTSAVLEEEKRLKEDEDKIREEKILNVKKRFQYSKLVKEMFLPTVGNSRKSLRSSRSGENSIESIKKNYIIKKIGVTDYKSELGMVRPVRKSKEIEPERKKIVVKDYLAEGRRNREKRDEKISRFEGDRKSLMENFDEGKAKWILEKAELIDSKAKQKELFLGDLKFKSKKGIEAGEEVDDLILSSIKAKLALLDKFQNESF